MSHALDADQLPPPAPPAPNVIEQASVAQDGRKIYGTVLPPSKRIDVLVRFWREDDPEVWQFSARPKLDITTLRRVGGLMKMAEVQQYREQTRQAAAQARARAQQRGEKVPDVAEAAAGDMLPQDVLDSVDDILRFVGGMMTDRDGVKASWDPNPNPHLDLDGRQVERGKDVIPPPLDTPSWAHQGYSIRLPDSTIVPADDSRVADAARLGQASSKRRWRELVEIDDEVELGLDAIMELVGDLVGQWAGGEEGGRPLDEPASSGKPSTSPGSVNGSVAGSPSPA